MSWDATAAAWWSWMAAMLWQSSLLVAMIAVLDRLLRGRMWPELLHGLWLLVAAKLLLPPHLPAPWREPRRLELGRVDLAGAPSEPSVYVSLGCAVWLVGVFAWLAASSARQRRFQRAAHAESRPATRRVLAAASRVAKRLGLRRSFEVRELLPRDSAGAFVVGCRHPVVFLPAAWAARLDDEALEHVLAHELAHVLRGDLWLEHALAHVQALYWFHPLVPFLRNRCRAARELCCDATATRSLGDARGYRATLLALASELIPKPQSSVITVVTAGLLGRRSLLLARLHALERVLASRSSPGRLRRVTLATLLCAAACGLPLAAPAPEDASAELQEARAAFASLAGRDDVGSLHLRWAVARVAALEQRDASASAAPP